MCGMSLRSHSQHSLAFSGTQFGRVASSSSCDVAVMQRRNRSRTQYTGVYSRKVSALHRSRHSPSLPFFTDRRFGLGLCHVFFYRIVMAKCIFLMSCITEKKIPVGEWRCLFFLMHMSFGTISYNDFLLPLFKPCFKMEGV